MIRWLAAGVTVAFPTLKFNQPIPKTAKLFHGDPSHREAKARVIHIDGEYVVLDQSIFYPESGGQEWDTGTIAGIRVLDVQDQGGRLLLASKTRFPIPSVKIDTVIVHKLEGPPHFSVGDEVELALNWPRRWNLMRSHGSAHFLYYACRQLWGTEEEPLLTKGCHITEDKVRFDFSGDFSADKVSEISAVANSLIASSAAIRMERSEVSDEVYYWTCNDIIIPCGGTHVSNTDHLPKILIRRSKKGSGVTRVSGELIFAT